MTKLIMGIGIPGAGKTTFLKNFAGEYGYDYICPDDLRLEMFGEIEDRTTAEKEKMWGVRNRDVWNEARKRLKDFLDRGDTVVFDATFSNSEGRKRFIDFARESGAEKIQGVYVDTPLELAKQRNQQRERNVREVDMERMAVDLKENKPKIEEGFDGVFTLDEYQKLIEAEMKGGEAGLRRKFT